jgi:hypothetical protein
MSDSKRIPDFNACLARSLREVSTLARPTYGCREFDSPEFRAGTDQAIETRKANRMRTVVVMVMCVVSCSLFGIARSANAQSGQTSPTYYSIQHADDWPPLPANIWGFPEIDLGNGMIGLNDVDVDYDQLREEAEIIKLLNSGGPYSLNNAAPTFLGTGAGIGRWRNSRS